MILVYSDKKNKTGFVLNLLGMNWITTLRDCVKTKYSFNDVEIEPKTNKPNLF